MSVRAVRGSLRFASFLYGYILAIIFKLVNNFLEDFLNYFQEVEARLVAPTMLWDDH